VKCQGNEISKYDLQSLFVKLFRYTQGYEHGLTFATIKVGIHFLTWSLLLVKWFLSNYLFERIINLKYQRFKTSRLKFPF
jgi:hypothetical protein